MYYMQRVRMWTAPKTSRVGVYSGEPHLMEYMPRGGGGAHTVGYKSNGPVELGLYFRVRSIRREIIDSYSVDSISNTKVKSL